MSNQAMTYESLKEATRQEFEDIKKCLFWFQYDIGIRTNIFFAEEFWLEGDGVFIDIRPGTIIPDTLGDLHWD